MSHPRIAIEGQTFGRLTVLEYVGSDRKLGPVYMCECSCGELVDVDSKRLRKGRKKSCGCLQHEFTQPRGDAASRHPLYRIWCGMRKRCRNPRDARFEAYGGRGITVDPRWDDFWQFASDMGVRPSLQHSVDRIDNDGPYSPDNCRWATPEEQRANQRCPCCHAAPQHQRRPLRWMW